MVNGLEIEGKVFLFLFFIDLFIKSVVIGWFMCHSSLFFIQLDQVRRFKDLLSEITVIQFAIQYDFI